MPTVKRVRRGPVKRQRLTIWDNFERHRAELEEIGASPEQIAQLRRAAEAVARLEEKADRQAGRNPHLAHSDLADITAPRTCANGWVVQPPTLPARRWAAAAVLKVTGGAEPNDALGVAYAVLVGLWILRRWGDGRLDEVMQLVTGPGRLAAAIPEIEDASGAAPIDALAKDYMALMGLAPQKKSPPAVARYRKTLSAIRASCSGPSTPASSASSSSPGESSA